MCAHMCADACLWGVHTCVCLYRQKPEYNLRCHFSGVRCHLCFCVYMFMWMSVDTCMKVTGVCLHLPPCLRQDPSLLLLIVAFSMLNIIYVIFLFSLSTSSQQCWGNRCEPVACGFWTSELRSSNSCSKAQFHLLRQSLQPHFVLETRSQIVG